MGVIHPSNSSQFISNPNPNSDYLWYLNVHSDPGLKVPGFTNIIKYVGSRTLNYLAPMYLQYYGEAIPSLIFD